MGDIEENYGKISEPTFYSYIMVLKNLFVIDNVPAWAPNIRSKQKMRRTEKKEFIDPSIAVAGLSVTPEMLVYDLETFGFIFETLCIRDLKVYSAPLKMDKLIKQKIAKGDTHIPEPSFLAVITGDQIAKIRKDGVMVIPIGALR